MIKAYSVSGSVGGFSSLFWLVTALCSAVSSGGFALLVDTANDLHKQHLNIVHFVT